MGGDAGEASGFSRAEADESRLANFEGDVASTGELVRVGLISASETEADAV